jgi:DNA-binding beta-propeller fold protein YncE
LHAAVKLVGKAPDWDYLSYDAARGRLFIARRDAGLWVYDTRRQRLLRRMPKTGGAGASLLIPALGRGYATNEDGSVTVFNLATLVPIRRVKFAEDADAASYEPVSGRIAFVSADSRRVTFMDARSLAVVGHVDLEAKKADASVADGAGAILLNERDRNMVARIDAASARITAEWPTTGCTQPTGLAYDAANHRAFVGCRGPKPVLAVLNTQSGAIVATLDLGRGNDGVAYDRAHRRIITTNGVEGNIVVFHQDDADHYRLEQAITTRPSARTLAVDTTGQRIFTVTAEGVVNPAQPANAGPSAFYPNAYYDNSFTVLTYKISN